MACCCLGYSWGLRKSTLRRVWELERLIGMIEVDGHPQMTVGLRCLFGRFEAGPVQHVFRGGELVFVDLPLECREGWMHQFAHALLGFSQRAGDLAAVHVADALAGHCQTT